VFLAYYVIYTTYLVLDATQHAALPAFTAAVTWFLLPLTGLTLAVLLTRAWRRPK
jgi:cation:H+ antiporter